MLEERKKNSQRFFIPFIMWKSEVLILKNLFDIVFNSMSTILELFYAQVRELYSLYIHIYIFLCSCFFKYIHSKYFYVI